MCPRISLRIPLVLLISVALLPVPCVSILVDAMGQSPGRAPRGAPPRPGKPEGVFPDLDEVKNESWIEREPPAPVPSTIRSPRNSGQPWDGRRVGDPFPNRGSDQARVIRLERKSKSLRSHALRHRPFPFTIYEDQFIQNFFSVGLLRSTTYEETLYWYYQFRAAYNDSAVAVKHFALELGRTVFESAAYAARQRDAHTYVQDLYKTYLMREPDATGWANWETTVGTQGREYVRRGFEESTEFATLLANLVPSGPPGATATSLISARVDPRNQPGNGMLTRDAAWSVSLLSLPGRNGLDLGLALSYSSMVWTRSGPYIYFDEDNGFPSPGFRLGFPTVQRQTFDAQTGRKSYLMITASGTRVELRQVGTSNIYDAADSSYLRLTENGSTLLVHSTNGTKLSFSEINGEYRCVEIKDRNGNYITVNNNSLGHISGIVDTLGRVINFNYDSNANLISITQAWNGQPSHQWVSFWWGTRTMQSSFTGPAVVGVTNGAILPVITQVGLNDASYFTFDYTNSLQVSVIRKYFGTAERNTTSFTYEAPGTDVPRLLGSSVSAQNWTGINGVPAQVTTQYSVTGDGACVLTAPDGTIYKEYYGTGWQRGLTMLSEVWSAGVRQKWTTTAWTQDNTSAAYEVNPRITETNVYDKDGNRRRTVIDYGAYAAYGLPYGVHEYAADGSTEVRQSFTDYNLSQAYLDRRIIGLVSQVRVANGAQSLTKITYDYDDPARLHGVPAAATQHDVNYNLFLTARGNVTAVSRWDVDDVNNATKKLTSFTDYYNTGTPISTTDAAGHQSSMTYGDSFSDGGIRNTFAYPTTITDADNFSSYVQYNFDFGATTRTQSPAPAGQSQGAIQTMSYNGLGQLERITTTNNGAYKRFWYGADYTASYASVNNVADEAYSIEVVDGVGRVIGTVTNHPGSHGGYSLVSTIYDQMGRASKVSNPTEVSSSWVPDGDDGAGIYYTQQTYDWKGRPRITTNPDGTTKEISYTGCGCAGGEVATLTDEGTIDAGVAKRRQQKIYSDVLGRTWKTETLNWQGGSVYSATVNTYNARDQVTQIRQYAGPEGSGTYQDTTLTYDGYGRVRLKHVPQQTAGAATTYAYNNDDTVQSVTDARGAATMHSYNNRHLVSGTSYSVPPGSGIGLPPPVTYAYDAAGNRTSMMDGLGATTYTYDSLSRMTSETRTISDPALPYLHTSLTLSYAYNLAGQLKAITDPWNVTINYAFDSAGRLTSVSGVNYGASQLVNSIAYRAWGAPRQIAYGNGRTALTSYDARMRTSHFEIPSAGGLPSVMSIDYQYYADGRIRYSHNLLDPRFDRSYEYDHATRIIKALSGAEAWGEPATTDRPYHETFAYDAFNHFTSRETQSWSNNRGFWSNDSYNNNRRVGWTYDSQGKITNNIKRQYAYDAVGQTVVISSPAGSFNQVFDGDGNRIKTTEFGIATYYLWSTVLGQVVNELNSTGASQRRFVYTGGKVLAESGLIVHAEVSGTTVRKTSAQSGYTILFDELDPLGADAYTEDPYVEDPNYAGRGEGGPVYPGYGNISDPSRGCTSNGVYDVCAPDISLWGTSLVSLPGFGTEWGSFSQVQERQYELRLAYTRAQLDAIQRLRKGASLPQNPATGQDILPSSLLANIFHLLDDDRCSTFVSNLINVARQLTGKNPYTYDGKALAVAVDRQENGGFIFRSGANGGGGGGSAYGDIFSGQATVEIAMFNTAYDGPRDYQGYYALTALHEIIHLAGGGASLSDASRVYYMDVVLARAARILTGAAGYPEAYNSNMPVSQITGEMTKSAGLYWDKQLKEHCMPTEWRERAR